MAEFKGKAIVSRVGEEFNYVLSEDKACTVITQNVVADEDFAKQFSDVAKLYGKVPKEGEITCHAFVLSPAPEDAATVERLAAYTKDVMELLFSEYQVVAAVHGDSGILHSHIVVNAVNFVTGDKLNVSMTSMRKMRDTVDDLGLFYGFSPHDPTRRAEMVRFQVSELREMQAGRHDWRWDIRLLVQDACIFEFTEEGFKERMRRCDVDVTDSKDGTDFIFHTVNSKNEPRRILGSRLGMYFCKEYILWKLENNRFMISPGGIPDEDEENLVETPKDAPSAISETASVDENPVYDEMATESEPFAEVAEREEDAAIEPAAYEISVPAEKIPEAARVVPVAPDLSRRRVDLSGFSSLAELDADTVADLYYNRQLDFMEENLLKSPKDAYYEPISIFALELQDMTMAEIKSKEEESERRHPVTDPPARSGKKAPLGLSRGGVGPSLTDLRGDRYEDAVARLDEIIREAVKKAESEKKPGFGEKILAGLKAAFSKVGRALSGFVKKALGTDKEKVEAYATGKDTPADGQEKKPVAAEAETHEKIPVAAEQAEKKEPEPVPVRAAEENPVSAESVSLSASENPPLPEVGEESSTAAEAERIAAIIEAGRARAERENKAYVKMLNDYRDDAARCRETNEDVLTLSEYQELSEEEREERAFLTKVWLATSRLRDEGKVSSVYLYNWYTLYDIWADYARHELDCGRLYMNPYRYMHTVDNLLKENGGSMEKVREKVRFNPPSEFIPMPYGDEKDEVDGMLLRLHGGVGADEYLGKLRDPLDRERSALEREMKKAERERGGNQRYKDGK